MTTSAAVLPARISVAEFILRPERMDGWQEELIDGEIILSPNAKKIHVQVSAKVFQLLLPLQQQGFLVLGETPCRLTNESLPNTDVAVVDAHVWSAVDDDDYLKQSPSLAIEVFSKNNRRSKLLRKVELYLEYGAEQVWLIYPAQTKVVAYFPDGTSEQFNRDDALTFHDCQVNVSDLF